MNREFVFERDSGILFQRAKMPEQPYKLKINQFTKIPRLESVSAEEYNRQFEEMIRSMPKNLAYSDKFGTENIIPPGLSSRKPKPVEKPRPVREVQTPVQKKKKKEVVKEEALPKPQPKPEPKKPEPKQEDENIVFYTGYNEPEVNPFTDTAAKDKEIFIDNQTKPKAKSGKFTDRFKQTFHKLFSTPAEDEFPDNFE